MLAKWLWRTYVGISLPSNISNVECCLTTSCRRKSGSTGKMHAMSHERQHIILPWKGPHSYGLFIVHCTAATVTGALWPPLTILNCFWLPLYDGKQGWSSEPLNWWHVPLIQFLGIFLATLQKVEVQFHSHSTPTWFSCNIFRYTAWYNAVFGSVTTAWWQ